MFAHPFMLLKIFPQRTKIQPTEYYISLSYLSCVCIQLTIRDAWACGFQETVELVHSHWVVLVHPAVSHF